MTDNPNKNKRLMINMIASLLSCVVSLAISFVLSPIIIANIGFEGNGFIDLANQFVNYANIAAMALNSMAGRFITVKIHQKDYKSANQYFTSVLYCNMGIVAFLMIPITFVVLFLDSILEISPALTGDVKLLFALIFLNFMVTIISTTFSTATFATNRLDLTSLRTIESQLLKAGILILAFTIFPIKVFYVGLATLFATVYLLFSYLYYTKKLLPDIHISKKYFDVKKVLEILSAGIWNTVMRTGQVLTNGLDSLITNVMISSIHMGYVGTSKIVATAINTLYETVAAVFTPSLTISFAKDNKEEMVSDVKTAMKLTGFFANIPLAYVIGFGVQFYSLWLVRAQSITDDSIIYTIYLLTVLTMFGTIVGGAISPLFNIFTVVNKLKWNAFVILGMGIVSTITVLVTLNVMPNPYEYGIYVVVACSTFIGIIKNLTFTPMYAAHCLGIKKRTFYPTIIRYVVVSILMICTFVVLNHYLVANTWPLLILSVLICGIIGSLLNFFLLFEKKEREMLGQTLLAKFLKK